MRGLVQRRMAFISHRLERNANRWTRELAAADRKLRFENAALRVKLAEISNESELNVENLVANNIYAIAVVNEKGHLVFINKLFEILSGYSAAEILPLPISLSELISESQQGGLASHALPKSEQERVSPFLTLDLICKSGNTVPVECAVRPIVWHDQPCTYIVACDIAERIKSEQLLRDSEVLFRSVAEGAFDGISLLDEDGVFLYVNEKLAATTQYAVDELIGAHYAEFISPEDIRRIDLRFERLQNGARVPQEYDSRLTRRDGVFVPVSVSLQEITLNGRRALIASYKDISVRKRMEHELLQIAEWERIRIAQELHDTVGQHISGMAYLIEVLAIKLKRDLSPHADSAIDLVTVARQAHGHLREVVKALMPLASGAKLSVALEALCEATHARTGAVCSFADDGLGQVTFDAVTADHLRCIAQESVVNATRHGQAKNILITLTRKNDQGILCVEDDGRGFDLGNHGFSGSGLRILEYRSSFIEGILSIKRRESGGMSVSCTFILPSAADGAEHHVPGKPCSKGKEHK